MYTFSEVNLFGVGFGAVGITAQLLKDGAVMANARNKGDGSATMFFPVAPFTHKDIDKAEKWARKEHHTWIEALDTMLMKQLLASQTQTV